MTAPDFAPIHPGEILETEFLEPLDISQYRIAKAIGVSPRRINEIVQGKRGITADTGLRLSRALGLSDMFWINLQARYDAELAQDQLAATLMHIAPILATQHVKDAAPTGGECKHIRVSVSDIHGNRKTVTKRVTKVAGERRMAPAASLRKSTSPIKNPSGTAASKHPSSNARRRNPPSTS
jgi:addiction module HigA family antidote